MNGTLKGVWGFIGDLWYFIIHSDAREIVTALIIIAITSIVTGVLLGHLRMHEEFMGQCMEDHKKYVCTLLWRDGIQGTAIAPTVIPSMSP